MVHEPLNPNYEKVVKTHEYKQSGVIYSCPHDTFFWDAGRKADFGDTILCNTCGQYLVKLRDLPWIAETNYHFRGKHLDKAHLVNWKGGFYHPIGVRVTN